MKTPTYLKRGDCVAIVSTARKILPAEIQNAQHLLESWGLKTRIGRTIGAKNNQFAGDDIFRAQDFQEQLDDPKINAIWCARGGYGTVRMIDLLDFSTFIKQPKWLIGYSDVTVLHSHIHNIEIQTLHSFMPIDVSETGNGISKIAVESLKNALFGKKLTYNLSVNKFNKNGRGKGVLIGGNLSILYSLCGSNSAIQTNRKILFIEDLDEYIYHIDRMMQNLKRNNLLKNLSGLIVGGMTKMHDNTIPFGKTVKEIILDTVSEYDFPVVFNFPAGHQKNNQTLIFGNVIDLEVSDNKVALQYIN
ncbi:MAG: S66 peptidase family protein [Flavobacteriales bacterium]